MFPLHLLFCLVLMSNQLCIQGHRQWYWLSDYANAAGCRSTERGWGFPLNKKGCGLSPRLENDMQTVPTCAIRGLGHHSTSILLINKHPKRGGECLEQMEQLCCEICVAESEAGVFKDTGNVKCMALVM